MDINVVVGLPIVYKLEDLYGDEKIHLYTNERFLPNILTEIGFFKSNSDVRKNRPDLFTELKELDFLHIWVGKKHLWLTVGKEITNKIREASLNLLKTEHAKL